MDGTIETTESKEQPRPSIFYHQTTSEAAKDILSSGFKRGLSGAGHDGPLRGIFLKENPELLSGARIGQTQLQIELNPKVKLLNITDQRPASFVRLPIDATGVGTQDFALAGWLERNGFKELSEEYQDAINKLYKAEPRPEMLNTIWPSIESLLEEKGYGGIKYLDHYLEGEKAGKTFPSMVVFNPDNLSVRK